MPAKPSSPSVRSAAAHAPAHAPARPTRGLRLLLALLGVLLLLGAGHVAAWAWIAGRLEEGTTAWAALRRAEGWQVSHGPAARGGWPLRATLTLPAVTLRREGFAWEAEKVVLTLAPPRFDRLRIEASGRQALELAGRPVPVAAKGLAAELPVGPDALGLAGLPRDAVLQAERLRLDLPGPELGSGPMELGPLRLDLATGNGAGAGDVLAMLRGTAARLVLPPALAAAPGLAVLGPTLERLSFDLALTGPWPGMAGAPALRAARWRDGGGTLEVRSLALRWGAADASASATLTLDEALQPAGAGALRLAGALAVLEAARDAGLIGRRDAAGAQMLLAMMQRTPPDGGPPRIEVPVVIERGALALAGLRLLRLPDWRWPGAAGR